MLSRTHAPNFVCMYVCIYLHKSYKHKLTLTCSKLSWELSSCGSDVFVQTPDALDGPLKSAVAELLG